MIWIIQNGKFWFYITSLISDKKIISAKNLAAVIDKGQKYSSLAAIED
jgi:hypothetical protein